MTEKFKDLPVEADTTIISSVQVKIDPYDVVYQKWYWGGFHAESIIFYNDDVAQLTEEEIKNEVKSCPGLIEEGSQISFKKGETFTFVNFNFVST
ncbi:MAG TPA: hypothetical protein VKX40_03760 [Aequorivita sp.]|nr:hypothetical protein [Aequorivita sp.]